MEQARAHARCGTLISMKPLAIARQLSESAGSRQLVACIQREMAPGLDICSTHTLLTNPYSSQLIQCLGPLWCESCDTDEPHPAPSTPLTQLTALVRNRSTRTVKKPGNRPTITPTNMQGSLLETTAPHAQSNPMRLGQETCHATNQTSNHELATQKDTSPFLPRLETE